MKANLTLKLDSSLIREARILAAKKGTSISALLGQTLETVVRDSKNYNRSKKAALAVLREGLDIQWKRPKSRDEIHER